MMKKRISLLFIILLPFVDLITALNERYGFMPISVGIIYKVLIGIFLVIYILLFSKSKYKTINIIYWLICLLYVFVYFLSKQYIFMEKNVFIELSNLAKFIYTGFVFFGFLTLVDDLKLDRKKINDVLFFTLIIYSSSLLISYFTDTGFATYPLRENFYGTIGWFFAGNELSAIILILYPSYFIKYNYIDRKYKIPYLLLFIPIIFSIFIIGTKVSWFGILLLTPVITILFIKKKWKHKKEIFPVLGIFLLVIVLSFFAPTIKNFEKSLNDEVINVVDESFDEAIGDKEILITEENYVGNHCGTYYNFNSDLLNKILSGRENKAYTLYNIYNNGTITNKLLGIGFTNNSVIGNCYVEIYSEIDLLDVLFHYGVVGLLIVLIPFIYIFKLLLKIKKLTFDIAVYLFTALLLVGLSFVSGHIIGYPSCSIYFAIILLFLINSIKEKVDNINIGEEKMQAYIQNIYNDTKKSYYNELREDLKNKKKRFIVTVNPETLMMSESDKEMAQILEDKSVSFIPDGIAVVKAARILNNDVKERIAGIDIATYLLEEANRKGYSLYLFGAKEEVIDSLLTVIKNEYPNIKVLGYSNGYVDNRDKVMKEVIKLKPDICMVALGIPDQEKLIYKYLNKFDKGIFIGVGGSFDVLSGTKKRAPKIFIKLNLEWLYRIVTEPKRLKRFWNNNIKFMFKIKK